jgi:hypothetical protein
MPREWLNEPTGVTVSAATTAEQSKINFRREFIWLTNELKDHPI